MYDIDHIKAEVEKDPRNLWIEIDKGSEVFARFKEVLMANLAKLHTLTPGEIETVQNSINLMLAVYYTAQEWITVYQDFVEEEPEE